MIDWVSQILEKG